MEIATKIRQIFDGVDEKRLQLAALIAAAIVACMMSIIIFFFYRNMNALRQQIKNTQIKRQEATALLERYYLVKKQQTQVYAILDKERDFKITQAFEKLLQKVGIISNKAQESETTSQQVLDSYTEWTLYANLINLTTKKLTELLYAIEQEERIYTKEVEIEKAGTERTINVKITIATLEPQTIQESAEQ